MLDLSECRQYISPDVSNELSDDELKEVRNRLYKLAETGINTLESQ